MEKQNYYYAVGKRKTAVARVKLMRGTGSIMVNGVPYEERFPRPAHRRAILQPMVLTETADKYDVVVKVIGSGISGQGGAISHGIARALVRADEKLQPVLRKTGMLTRDSRVKERKKPGLKRARKAPQYTKR